MKGNISFRSGLRARAFHFVIIFSFLNAKSKILGKHAQPNTISLYALFDIGIFLHNFFPQRFSPISVYFSISLITIRLLSFDNDPFATWHPFFVNWHYVRLTLVNTTKHVRNFTSEL